MKDSSQRRTNAGPADGAGRDRCAQFAATSSDLVTTPTSSYPCFDQCAGHQHGTSDSPPARHKSTRGVTIGDGSQRVRLRPLPSARYSRSNSDTATAQFRHFRQPRALGNARHRTGVRATFSSRGSPRVMGLVRALERVVSERVRTQGLLWRYGALALPSGEDQVARGRG
jgi:hypothetical protein